MIFSELYSAYYNTVAKIIGSIIDGERDERKLLRIVTENAFGESITTILPALKSGRWQLMRGDMTTPLEHKPTMPLTLIEKRWLKAISLDPRIRLFGIELEGLDGIDPLFTADDYVVYDKYSDGDDFEDEGYIERFRLILDAIKNAYPIKITMINRSGNAVVIRAIPKYLEYSEKDDKFRVITCGRGRGGTVNLGRIVECKRYYGDKIGENRELVHTTDEVTLEITDERNALERVMLHFAHFEKRAERIDDMHYRLYVKYDCDDETELVIRILSFGPLVRVTAPEHFVERIRDRLVRQMGCNLK